MTARRAIPLIAGLGIVLGLLIVLRGPEGQQPLVSERAIASVSDQPAYGRPPVVDLRGGVDGSDRSAAIHAVDSRAYSGALRVGAESDYTAFLGDGVLQVRIGEESGAESEVAVEGGLFSFSVPGDEHVWVVGGLLEETAIQLPGPCLLQAGSRQPVYFTWGPRRVEVAVLDRETGEHLGDVDILREPVLRFSYDDPVFTGDRQVIPTDSDVVVKTGVSSPFALEVPPAQPERFWITSDGYVPFRYRYPAGLPRTELVVSLSRGGSAMVVVGGDVESLKDCVLRLHEVGLPRIPWLSPPVAQLRADWEQRIDGLAPGDYGVVLARKPNNSPDEMVLASSVFTVDLDQEARVLLDASSPSGSGEPAHVVVELPSPRTRSGAPGTAQLIPHGVSPSTLSGALELEWSAPTEWGPLELDGGDYTLVLLPDNVSLPFSVSAGETRRLSVPAYDLVDCFLTILDARTAEPIAATLAYWSSALAWDGTSEDWPLSHRVPLSVDEFPIPLCAPRARLQLLVRAEGYGEQEHVLDLAFDADPVILLHPLACLELELRDMDEAPTMPWLWDIELIADGEPVEVNNSLLVTEGGTKRAELYFTASGSVQVRLPPLPSQGALRPLELEFQPGERRRVSLGPGGLLGAD